MGVAVADGKLDETEPVAMQPQARGLGVDRDAAFERDGSRKIAAMEVYGHSRRSC
jgi:hypothetical protein